MRVMTILRIREGIVAAALLLLLGTAGLVAAQELNDREINRIEHQLQTMQDQHVEIRVNNEQRWARLEAQIALNREEVAEFKKAIYGVLATLALLVIETLWGLIVSGKTYWRIQKRDKE